MTPDNTTSLNAVLSVASHFVAQSEVAQIAPVHLFLALLTLEIIGEELREADEITNDELYNLCSELEIVEDQGIFTYALRATTILKAQVIQLPNETELLGLLKETHFPPPSKEAQSILDCAISLMEASDGSLIYLTSLALATIGSDDLEINRMLEATNVNRDQMAKEALDYHGQLLNSTGEVYVTAGNTIFQALLNNELEKSIPDIVIGLSHKTVGTVYGDTLVMALVLGNRLGEDCEPAKFQLNWAYSLMLGLLVCDKKGTADSASRIKRIMTSPESLTGKKANGALATLLTMLVDGIPLFTTR